AVLVAMVASLTVLPVMLALLGPRINALRISLPRSRRRAAGEAGDSGSHGAWAAIARSVMRRPVLYIVAVLAAMTVLGLPAGGVRFAGPDTRVLPVGSEARVVSERIAARFPRPGTGPSARPAP